MLVHYRCGGCGATLAALDDYAGHTVPCSLCRQQNVVPKAIRVLTETDVADAQEAAVREEFAAYVAQQSEEEARRVAWLDAQVTAGRGKALGVVLIVLGAVPALLALLAVVTRSLMGFPMVSLAVSMAFGAVAMTIGLQVRQASAEAVQEEFNRRLPIVLDQVRRDHWRTWEAQYEAQRLAAQASAVRRLAAAEPPARTDEVPTVA